MKAPLTHSSWQQVPPLMHDMRPSHKHKCEYFHCHGSQKEINRCLLLTYTSAHNVLTGSISLAVLLTLQDISIFTLATVMSKLIFTLLITNAPYLAIIKTCHRGNRDLRSAFLFFFLSHFLSTQKQTNKKSWAKTFQKCMVSLFSRKVQVPGVGMFIIGKTKKALK